MRYSDYMNSKLYSNEHEKHIEEFYTMCHHMINLMFPVLFKEYFYKTMRDTGIDKKIEIEADIRTFLNGEAIHARKELTRQIASLLQDALMGQSINIIL